MSEQFTPVNYLHVFRRRWTFILVVTLIVVFISLVFTLLQPFQYQSQVKILVIQKSAIGIDAYSASKSAERIGRNLGQVIYSSSFFSKVLNSGYDIDKDYFPTDEEKKREEWQKMISTDVPTGTTILNIDVYHETREQAQVIAEAIAYVLLDDAYEYVGVADVELKIVDEPLTSNFPVKPNVFLNLVLGLVVGFFLALSILMVTFSEDREFEHLQLRHEKKIVKSQARNFSGRNFPVPASLQSKEKSHFENNFGLDKVATPEVEKTTPEKSLKQDSEMPSFSDEDQITTMKS